jgi:hypothetical protein
MYAKNFIKFNKFLSPSRGVSNFSRRNINISYDLNQQNYFVTVKMKDNFRHGEIFENPDVVQWAKSYGCILKNFS